RLADDAPFPQEARRLEDRADDRVHPPRLLGNIEHDRGNRLRPRVEDRLDSDVESPVLGGQPPERPEDRDDREDRPEQRRPDEAYWSSGVPRDVVERAIDGSICFSAFAGDPDRGAPQVAFARVVTDKATFAWLCDVFVLVEHRRKGVAKQMMDAVMSHPDVQGLRKVLLATRDAHGLYARYGFVPSPSRRSGWRSGVRIVPRLGSCATLCSWL